MPIVTFIDRNKKKTEIEVPKGANLRKEALKASIPIYPWIHKFLHCPGLAQCGSCRVLITKGMENASEMGVAERARFMMSMARIGYEETMRLSCQTLVEGDMTVEIQPPLNLYGENFFS